MRDADATIERLLAGLRDAEPSAGIERRLLAAMETHPAVASASSWHRLTLPWLWAMAMLLACVLAFTLKVHRHRDTPAYIRSHATAAGAPQATMPKAVAQIAPTRRQRRASPLSPKPPHTRDVLAETAGFPAPPLPLTNQEKLLLRLAHRIDAQDMTLLNRDAQAEQSAKATQQFQQFFDINPTEMRTESE